MNEQEIMRQLKNCDTEINDEYSKFRNNIFSVGNAAAKAIDSHRLLMTLIPALVGVVACMLFYISYHAIFALLCLAGGGYFAYLQFQSIGANKTAILQAKNALDNANNRVQNLDA